MHVIRLKIENCFKSNNFKKHFWSELGDVFIKKYLKTFTSSKHNADMATMTFSIKAVEYHLINPQSGSRT